jgi:uncharacterized cofD-like protein
VRDTGRGNERGLRIVAVGGGTGLSTLLGGLKAHVGREIGPPGDGITAVVTVTDNGGSSGRLREEFNILPPGDIRNCMVALAEDEQLLTRLFRYRFAGDGHLGGHSFGNLFLTALTDVTGDFAEAVKMSSEVLAIEGRIVPSTTVTVDLVAELRDGRTVTGEREIAESGCGVRRIRLSNPDCRPLPETLEAIASADVVALGPGSLYSSVIPNLLVPGIGEAIARTRALKVYICNCMTQPGETAGFTVEDHLRALAEHAPAVAPDVVIANALPISAALRERYLEEGAVPVMLGFGRPNALPEPGEREIHVPGALGRTARLLAINVIDETVVVRHDAAKLARALIRIAKRGQGSGGKGRGRDSQVPTVASDH